ncbi:hypothetical protein Syun_014711 [Stephania yunnanensis]|uniref:Uncharacterized protein n=1 Tax=Stephania yunnanensis TaxID=152371 RepID=A0AAP0JJU6_9MAGN
MIREIVRERRKEGEEDRRAGGGAEASRRRRGRRRGAGRQAAATRSSDGRRPFAQWLSQLQRDPNWGACGSAVAKAATTSQQRRRVERRSLRAPGTTRQRARQLCSAAEETTDLADDRAGRGSSRQDGGLRRINGDGATGGGAGEAAASMAPWRGFDRSTKSRRRGGGLRSRVSGAQIETRATF